jgi:hypothetical protein
VSLEYVVLLLLLLLPLSLSSLPPSRRWSSFFHYIMQRIMPTRLDRIMSPIYYYYYYYISNYTTSMLLSYWNFYQNPYYRVITYAYSFLDLTSAFKLTVPLTSSTSRFYPGFAINLTTLALFTLFVCYVTCSYCCVFVCGLLLDVFDFCSCALSAIGLSSSSSSRSSSSICCIHKFHYQLVAPCFYIWYTQLLHVSAIYPSFVF